MNEAWELYQKLMPYFEMDESQLCQSDFICELSGRFFEINTPTIEIIRSNYFANEWCCAVPDPTSIEKIAQYSPLLEIGAGNGFWANELSKMGTKIDAFDSGLDYGPKFFPVKMIETLDLDEFKDRTLLLIWPSDKLNWPFEIISSHSWQRIIYIGEWKGGRMANDSFFDYLKAHYEIKYLKQMPRFPLWKDSLYVLERSRGL